MYRYEGGPPKNQDLFTENCVSVLTCLNFSHLQSPLHLMQCTYWDVFSTAQNSVWTHQFWCLLVLLQSFVLPLLHRQNVSIWGLFSSGETKIDSWGKIRWLGRMGHGGHAVFGQKLPNTQRGVGRCTYRSPIMKWANVCGLSQQLQLVPWSRWVPRTLT